jgi:hypothetical protein
VPCIQVEAGKRGNVFGPLSIFTSKKKLEFLEMLKSNCPNFSECAKAVGITRWTFKNHYLIDKAFKLAVDEIVDANVDEVEVVRFKVAMTDNGRLDRMAILNAYRRERYNPDIHVEVVHDMPVDEANRRSQRIGQIVDAQIVQRVYDQKKLRDSNAA